MNIICERILPFLDKKTIIKIGNKNLLCKYVLFKFSLEKKERDYIEEFGRLPVFVEQRFWYSDRMIQYLKRQCILETHTSQSLIDLLTSGVGDAKLFKRCFHFIHAKVCFFAYDYEVCKNVLSSEPFRYKQYTIHFRDNLEIFFGDIRIGLGVIKNNDHCFAMLEHSGMMQVVNILLCKTGSIYLIDLYNKTSFHENKNYENIHRRPKIRRR
jgi:hypothetical protein